MIVKRDIKLGKQLRKLRKQQKLTQEEVANKLRVTPKYVQYLEAGKRKPSIKLLYRLADLLKARVKELFTF